MRKINLKRNSKETTMNSAPEQVVTAIKPKNEDVQLEATPLKEAEILVLFKLREAHKALVTLSSKRLESKLSNTRVVGVARELNELIKVMSVYEAV